MGDSIRGRGIGESDEILTEGDREGWLGDYRELWNISETHAERIQRNYSLYCSW